MCDQELQEIINIYRMLGIEEVDSIKDRFDLGEVDGRSFCKIEEKDSGISYTSSSRFD